MDDKKTISLEDQFYNEAVRINREIAHTLGRNVHGRVAVVPVSVIDVITAAVTRDAKRLYDVVERIQSCGAGVPELETLEDLSACYAELAESIEQLKQL